MGKKIKYKNQFKKKKKEIIQATAWMNPENMLSERNQSQKTTYYMIPFISTSF